MFSPHQNSVFYAVMSSTIWVYVLDIRDEILLIALRFFFFLFIVVAVVIIQSSLFVDHLSNEQFLTLGETIILCISFFSLLLSLIFV